MFVLNALLEIKSRRRWIKGMESHDYSEKAFLTSVESTE